MYTIHTVTNNGLGYSEMLSSGQTRNHVIRALIYLNLVSDVKNIPALPRFGKAVIFTQPIAYGYPAICIMHK